MGKRTKTASKRNEAGCASCASAVPGNRDRLEGLAMLALAGGLFALYARVGSPSFALEARNAVSLGAVFFVGVTASVSSCLALVGGLLLSVSASWCENRSGVSHARKFAPLALFNVGRLAGYFVFGGLIALLGKSVGLSLQATGLVTVALSLVMLGLGLKMLRLVPKNFCTVPLPGFLTARIRDLSSSNHPVAAPLLGALTFFVPCGFTQTVQLLALASGSFLAGGSIMLAFALGTLPALIGISALSAFADGSFGRLFFRFSGAVVTLLAVVNLQGGLTLAGVHPGMLRFGPERAAAAPDPNVTIDENGQQIISLSVSDHGYSPASFTVTSGKPTWIYAVAPEGVSGCARHLTTPAFNMSVAIEKGENWLGPVTPTDDFVIACSMGMFRADVRVVKG